MKPYSYDLRIRIFSYSLTHSIKETAEVFNVSTNTVYLIKRLFIETGDFKPRPRTRQYPYLITPEGELYIQLLIYDNPDITLRQLCEEYESEYGVKVSIATMSNTLKRLGFVRKKKVFYDPKKIKPGAEKLKKEYDRKLHEILPQNRFYLDETGFYLNMTSRLGWSRKGRDRHPVEAKPVHSPVRLNTLALVSQAGVQIACSYSGNLNGDRFIQYLETNILPLLKPDQVLIMDRHPAHCAAVVKAFLRAHHIPYLYLPPYSPELNPIEEIFAQIKQFIRRLKPRTLYDLIQRIKEAFQTITLDNINTFAK
jgi:transposase